MSDPARDIVDGLLKIGALNVQIAVMMTEAFFKATGAAQIKTVEPVTAQPPSHAEIEAVARVLERQILGDYELGFQAMLRLNFPRDRLREIAAVALAAAEDSEPESK